MVLSSCICWFYNTLNSPFWFIIYTIKCTVHTSRYHRHDVFLLILVHAYTNADCLTLHLFLAYVKSILELQYFMSLLSVLSILILCSLQSRKFHIVYIIIIIIIIIISSSLFVKFPNEITLHSSLQMSIKCMSNLTVDRCMFHFHVHR